MTESQRKNAESQRKMTDREKVIKAVECRKTAHERCGNPCELTGACEYAAWIRDPDGTPYYPCYCDVKRLCEDVLAMLRGQEPIVATWYQVDGTFGLEDGYKCGACNAEIEHEMRYCPWCGRKVKWDA